MRNHLKKYLLITFGSLFIILGIIGVILPILPTTPFLISALACFSKSSPRFHQLLLNNRWFGTTLQQWEDSRTIEHSSKVKAMILITLTFAISIAILQERLHLQLGLLTLAVYITCFYLASQRRQ
ncbi:MAG: YbaN family protein [Methylococcaceae bacterium]|nr:YbaN family protein [Methylococcaceae bacterium]